MTLMHAAEDIKSRGGRPRAFDRNQALEVAMRLFWRFGYEGVGISDLTATLNIGAPSLYAAFGSKDQLFREALQHYKRTSGIVTASAFESSKSLAEAIQTVLTASVEAVTSPDRERGCMISSGMISAHPERAELVQEVAAMRNEFRDALTAAIAPWTGRREAKCLARYLAAVLQGISIQSRDGATRAELMQIVDQALRGLDQRAKPERGLRRAKSHKSQ